MIQFIETNAPPLTQVYYNTDRLIPQKKEVSLVIFLKFATAQLFSNPEG